MAAHNAIDIVLLPPKLTQEPSGQSSFSIGLVDDWLCYPANLFPLRLIATTDSISS